jgi:parvulin-like peptidyl-prolyl isomerase
MRRWLKEPLLHFLLTGAVLFVAYAWLNHGAENTRSGERQEVRVSEGDVKWLAETWSRQWQREPSREELRGLVTDFLKEELLAREAREIGLEANDTIVRRRLAQKLEFLITDTARLADPAEEDLEKFYAAQPERFTDEARVSYAHIFFSREQRQDAAAEAEAALAALAQGGTAPSGDRLLVESEIHAATEQDVAAQFGPAFARAVLALKPGAWQGPIASGYGLHLVRVTELKPARQREFAAVRGQVLARWREERERETDAQYFAGLLKKYDVVVDESVKPLIGPLAAVAR